MAEKSEQQNVNKKNSVPEGTRSKPIILLAEDDTINMFLMRKILIKHYPEVQILEAKNGLEAVKISAHHNIDLILMDLRMPKKDGISAAKEIREIEAESNQHTPIVALTGMDITDTKEECLNAGMDDFLTKPVDLERLDEIFSTYLSTGKN